MNQLDIRFERTEQTLRSALLELLAQTPYSKISVTDICRLAPCSRNAFYQHYETKDHLYQSLVNEINAAIERSCRPVVSHLSDIGQAESKQFTDNILAAVDQHRSVITTLLKTSHIDFSKQIKWMLLAANIKFNQTLDKGVTHAYLNFFASGVTGFISYWLLETQLTLQQAQDLLHETVFYQIPLEEREI